VRCKTVKRRSNIIGWYTQEINPTEKGYICKALLEYSNRDALARPELREALPQKASVD